MKNLIKLRCERNLTTREMAKIFSVSKSTYNNWENGISEPSIKNLKLLAEFFCVTIDFLLGVSIFSSEKQTLSDKENRLLKAFSLLTEIEQEKLMEDAEFYASIREDFIKGKKVYAK